MSAPTGCECDGPGRCERHGCSKSPHLHRLCRTRPDYFTLWELKRGPGQPVGSYLTVAVVVVSHNYGRFLQDALESVLAQSTALAEIVVVDDSSDDDTRQIAESFVERGVRYIRVDRRNVHQARYAGFEATSSDVLCFLDADDTLTDHYIEDGLSQFQSSEVAVVYSDIERFGTRSDHVKFPAQFRRGELARDNFIHAGSLVRRSAILLSRPFDRVIDPLETQADWFLWRHVLRKGQLARKQSSLYRYRQHGENWMRRMDDHSSGYFDYAGLAHETLTLFIPLSGRHDLWPSLSEFLSSQSWPHHQISLILYDTSQDGEFSAGVRRWIAMCDYSDVRHVCSDVESPGLADQNRRRGAVRGRVRLAMARIYSRMIEMIATDYVWIIEDDILPPLDVAQRLLKSFEPKVGSVSALYRSRFDGKPCVWDKDSRHYESEQSGVTAVYGNGFGCVLLRSELLEPAVFPPEGDFDRKFYHHVASHGLQSLCDWTAICAHRDSSSGSAESQCECEVPGWCERHQCQKTPHFHRLCRTREDYFSLWEAGRGPGQDNKGHATETESREPGLLRKAVNFGRAVTQHVHDGRREVSDEIYNARLATCRACPSCDEARMVCREPSCGCRLTIKARWNSQRCPLNKWVEAESALVE